MKKIDLSDNEKSTLGRIVSEPNFFANFDKDYLEAELDYPHHQFIKTSYFLYGKYLKELADKGLVKKADDDEGRPTYVLTDFALQLELLNPKVFEYERKYWELPSCQRHSERRRIS